MYHSRCKGHDLNCSSACITYSNSLQNIFNRHTNCTLYHPQYFISLALFCLIWIRGDSCVISTFSWKPEWCNYCRYWTPGYDRLTPGAAFSSASLKLPHRNARLHKDVDKQNILNQQNYSGDLALTMCIGPLHNAERCAPAINSHLLKSQF